MAQAAKHAGTPAPAWAGSPLRPGSAGPTPMAHPEHLTLDEAKESYGSYAAAGGRAGARAAAATPATSALSTSSFSPPQPLVMLAVRPLGRVSRGGMGACFCHACRAGVLLCLILLDRAACSRRGASEDAHARWSSSSRPARHAAALGSCVVAARAGGCVVRQRSASSGGEQPRSTSRSHPTFAEGVTTTASRGSGCVRG